MSDKVVLAGNLDFISLADILQILGGNNSSGILAMKSQYASNPGRIYFVEGNPINASSGALTGIDAVYALFGWAEGRFEFSEEEVHAGHVIKQSRMEIVLDALRMMDDDEIEKVGPPSFDEGAAAEAMSGGKDALPIIKGPLVDYAYIINEEVFSDGKKIVQEGAHGKWMWVIFEGKVRVSRETANGPLTIAMLGEGCFIGTFEALLFGEYSRNATVTAEGEVRLCLLDAERLFEVYTALSSDFKNLLISLNGRLQKITDRAVEMYTKEDTITELSKDKEVLIQKGSSKEELLSIIEGEAYVMGQTRKGVFPLMALKKNDFFGHMPFMNIGHEPRSAAILASQDLKTDKLDIPKIQKEYKEIPGTFRNLMYHMATCISMTTSIACRLHEKG
jgi:CRP-like cAMP-binding protein